MAKRDAIGRRGWIGWIACAAWVVCSAQSPVATTGMRPATAEEAHSFAVQRVEETAPRGRPGTLSTRHGKVKVLAAASEPVAAAEEVQQGLVSLQDGKLTIHANNSDLAQILESMSALTGMMLKGTAATDHVFGVYGPGLPRNVLTQLLTGSSYDFVMAGVTADGVPRELILDVHDKGTTDLAERKPQLPASAGNGSQSIGPGSAETNIAAENSWVPQAEAANTEPLGPGAIAHVPPNEVEASGSSQDNTARVQQNLQRLRHIQEQQGGSQ